MNIDWCKCALNIRQYGLSLSKADEKIGEWKGFTAKIANGEIKEPKFSQALKLLDLHEQLCGPDKTRELLQ